MQNNDTVIRLVIRVVPGKRRICWNLLAGAQFKVIGERTSKDVSFFSGNVADRIHIEYIRTSSM